MAVAALMISKNMLNVEFKKKEDFSLQIRFLWFVRGMILSVLKFRCFVLDRSLPGQRPKANDLEII